MDDVDVIPSGTANEETTHTPKSEAALSDAFNTDYATAVNWLAESGVRYHQRPLEQVRSSLDELTSSQDVLLESVENENRRFEEDESFKELCSIMERTKEYHTKLESLKKEMTRLSEKSEKCKKRAAALQNSQARLLKQRQEEHNRQKAISDKLIAMPVAESE